MTANLDVQSPALAAGLSEMPDDARLWIFAVSRPLGEDESARLLAGVDQFLAQWHAHGHPVTGAREWRDGRFLFVAADERATGVSGCSIDSLYRVLKDVERDLRTLLTDASLVWFREPASGEIRGVSRPEFRALVANGEVGPETTVFDQTITTVGALRVGRFEAPLRTTWHARAFGVGE